MLSSMEPTLQWWRLNQKSRSNDKLAYFGLKPNRCKKKKKDSTTLCLLIKKIFTYDKSQKLTKKLTKQRTKYVCNYGFDCNITLCCRQ